MSTAPAAPALPYPAWFADLVDRAASVLFMHRGRMSSVPFEWFSDGDDLQFLASFDWRTNEPAQRVVVHYLRSGDFVCQSQIGDMFRIDPSCFVVDATVPTDEIDRSIWQQEQEKKQRFEGP